MYTKRHVKQDQSCQVSKFTLTFLDRMPKATSVPILKDVSYRCLELSLICLYLDEKWLNPYQSRHGS